MFRCPETSLRFGKAFPLLCKEGLGEVETAVNLWDTHETTRR